MRVRMPNHLGWGRRSAAEAEIERQAERAPVQQGQRPHRVHHPHRLPTPKQEDVGHDEEAHRDREADVDKRESLKTV